MKKYLRTISVVVAATAVIFALQAPTALAGASFNNDSQDNPTLEVGNYTVDPNGNNWSSSIGNVGVGDVVSFLFYYHNTGNETAHNTKARLSFNTSGSRVTANGTISADNASSVGRSVTVNAKSNNVFTGMTFHSALWYPNQDSNNPDPLPNGQTGSTVTGSGVNLGNITPGWSSQGYLVVRFTVQGYTNGGGSTPTATLSAYYNGSQVSRVVKGTAVELRWSSTNATECHKLAGAGLETGGATSGSDTVSPLAGDTTFSIQCTGPGGSKNANASVTVLNPVIEFRATLNGNTVTQVPRGTAPTLYWTSNASTCQALAGAGFSTGGVGSGHDTVSPLNGDTTFSMRCSGFSAPGDPVQKNLTVTVGGGSGYNSPPSVVTKSAINITSHGAQVRGTINPNGTASDYWFVYGLSPSLLNSPTSTIQVGSGTTPVEVNKDLNNLGLNPDTTYYFQIIGRNAHGITHGAVLSFHTLSEQDPSDVPAVHTNTATQVTQYSAQLNGSVNPNGATTSYWFEWGTTTNLGQNTSHRSAGSGTSYQNTSSSVSGLSDNTTYYFRVVAQNTHGTARGSIMSFATPSSGGGASAPYAVTNNASNITTSTTQLNASVTPNGASTSYWFEYGTSQSLGLTTPLQNAGSGASAQSVSASASNLQANTTYYFRVVAQNSYGRVEGSTRQFTTTGTQGSAPSAQTSSASGVDQNAATLNGFVVPNGASTSYWFEYGTSTSLGNTTGTGSVSAGSNGQAVSKAISGLSNNTTYYFRVVAQNTHGTSHGATLSFTTNQGGGGAGEPLAVTQSASNISTQSAQLNASVTPNGASTSYWFEYGTSQSLGLNTPLQNAGSGTLAQSVSASANNLQANTTYYFRVVAQNSYGRVEGSVLSFSTTTNNTGGAPLVTTSPATGVSQNSAVLNGTVNPNGNSTTYWFEYGTSAGFGLTTPSATIGSGTNSQNVSKNVTGLSDNTTYYFRTVAQNAQGTSYGSTMTFATNFGGGNNAPWVQTDQANNIEDDQATLQGRVDPNGASTSYWFEYGSTTSMGLTTPLYSLGSGSGEQYVSYQVRNLGFDRTYYFRVIASNNYGTTYGNVESFRTDDNNNNDNGREPYVVTNSATNIDNDNARLRGSVDANGEDTYAWFEYGTDDDNLRYDTDTFWVGSGDYSKDVSEYIRDLDQGTEYYFRLVARNDYGTDRGSIRSFTTDGNSDANDEPTVITQPATLVSTNSALLNSIIDPNGGATSAWFEWGFTPSLGFETISQSMGSGDNSLQSSYPVTGLVPDTTYYFRAVARNAEGRSYGSTLSFRTAKSSNGGGGGTVIINNTTNTGGNGLSCIVLVPALNVSELDAGNDFVFTVTYRNGCAYNLSNAFLKVILPTEVTFDSTNYPFFNRDANGISHNLGVLSPGMQASISISGQVHGNVSEGSTLIFSSVLNFNDEDGDFQSVSAYLSAVVGAGRTLGANILEAFGDLFNNWLFLLILLLLVLFLIWWIFFKEEKNEEGEVDPLRDDAHASATVPRSV